MSKSQDNPDEGVPLQPLSVSTEKAETRTLKGGWFVSKIKMIMLAIVFIILIVIIIVLAVLFGIATTGKREGLEKRDENVTVPSTTTTYTTTRAVPTTPGTEAWWNIRLPTNVIPKHYNIFMNITVDLPRFDGNVGIDIEVKNTTNLIILHNNGLNISSVEVHSKTGKGILTIENHFSFKKHQFHVIQMASNIPKGLYILKMKFHAPFESYAQGMYRGSFVRPDGKKVFFAATQFEPEYARKVFPCFDEPALKATYNVSIAHRLDYIALCNMPIYKTETSDGQKIDYYSKTVIMPTYLLAFVVGDFKYVETVSKNNITMRIYSRPSFIYKTKYSSSIAGKIMTFFENHLGIEYSLPKEDQVAVPRFGSGAMENWGLILYGESVLLWDPKQMIEDRKLDIALIMSHELAHQWFGNIVTCKWWDDLWLNEGFAQYFQYAGITTSEPSLNKEHLIMKGLSSVFTVDGYVTSNPIKPKVLDPYDLNSQSQTVLYNKAAFAIRMLEGFLGNETFLDGLKIYLEKHAFASVEADDLWRAMTEASCQHKKCVDVKQIMDTWILQMGFPVVNFKRKNSTHYLVSQSRFLLDEKEVDSAYKSPYGYKWVIPLTYVTNKQLDQHFTWMNTSSTVIEWNGNGWIKANVKSYGLYITNYEEENWKALALQLKKDHTVFSIDDRVGLLVDTFFLARANKLNYSTGIMMTEYMTKETKYIAWYSLFQCASFFKEYFPRRSKAYVYLEKYLVFLGKHQYESLGFNDVGSLVDKLQRTYFLSLFCKVRVTSCINNATERFRAWKKNPESVYIPPNLRDVVFVFGIAYPEDWDFLYSQYNKSKKIEAKNNVLYGLATYSDPWITQRYLSYTLEPGRLDKDDISTVFYYVSEYNSIGNQIAWSYAQANWQRIVQRFDGSVYDAYQSTIYSISRTFKTLYGLSEVQKFTKKIGVADSPFAKQIEDGIKKRINWRKKNQKDIESMLEYLLKKNNQM